jgi:hypothetical protein
MAVKLEYAFKSGTDQPLVHISAVETGLACNCVCPQCGSSLVAKNNPSNKRAPHFQHYNSIECDTAVETSLHLLAKDILDQEKQIVLPRHKERYIIQDEKYEGYGPLLDEEKEFLKYKLVKFDKVEVEVYQGGIKPDLIVWINGEPTMIEIFVTHRVDQYKLNKIKRRDIPTIEINLSKVDRSISREKLRTILMGGNLSSWLHNPLVELAKKDFQQEIQRKVKKEEEYRANDFPIAEKKRASKKRKDEHLDIAKSWFRSRTFIQLKGTEKKYGYSIFKHVSEKSIESCPLQPAKGIIDCLLCEYNAKFDSNSQTDSLSNRHENTNLVSCLHDIMEDRYKNS